MSEKARQCASELTRKLKYVDFIVTYGKYADLGTRRLAHTYQKSCQLPREFAGG
jgi:hypothetical protein